MSLLTRAYESLFKRVRGKGFGLGLFNRFHRLVYEGWLQPRFVVINGCKLYLPAHDEGVSENLRLESAWEPEMTAAFVAAVKPGMTVLDLGANVGYHSVLASRLVGPEGRVLAFEPDPSNLALLRLNAQVNDCRNLEIFPFAVADADGELALNLCGPNTGSHSTAYVPDGATTTVRVKAVRLDSFLGPERRPHCVKMDIEGGEAAALRGMSAILDDPRLRAVFIEVNPGILARLGATADELLAPLRSRGFVPRRLDPLNFVCERAAKL